MTFLQGETHSKELSLYRDQRLSPKERDLFETHLDSCGACQAEMQEAVTLQSLLAGFPKAEYSSERTDRIMQAIELVPNTEVLKNDISVWDWLLGPLRVMVPVSAAVAVCLLGLVWFSAPAQSSVQPPATSVEEALLGKSPAFNDEGLLDGLLPND